VPSNTPSIHEAVQFYEQIWSTQFHDPHAVEAKPDIRGDNYPLLSPVTQLDIEASFKRTKQDTAKGFDQVTRHEAKLLAEEDLVVAFSIWLEWRHIPSELKLNRTTLIPKGKEGLEKITNWKPIPISSIRLRLYNKIIVTYKNLCSKRINIFRGVKQGDSLPPLLFNLVTDELFEIFGGQFGYVIKNIGSTNIKCFTNEMCPGSGTKIGMGHMINETVKFLSERGLQSDANLYEVHVHCP
jgi:hypothetical protein